MPAPTKLTNSTDEVTFAALLGGEAVYSIPYFQRPYKWDRAKLKQLEDDILQIVDGQDNVHFLGAIITYDQPKTNSTQASIVDVIDGQQRLTTVFLYVCGLVRFLLDNEQLEEAQATFRKFLVVTAGTSRGSNLKLHTSHEDRSALNNVVRDLLDRKGFEKLLVGFSFKPLKAGSQDHSSGRWISRNYKSAQKFFKQQFAEGGLDRVWAIREALLSGLTVVQIVVQDPTTGPKIFDSLNSRQQPMTIGDLVRNDIFGRASDEDPDLVESLHEHDWLPFYSLFKVDAKNFFDDYFFPYALTQDPSSSKSTAFKKLVDRWAGMDPKSVIEELKRFQMTFMTLVAGTTNTEDTAEIVGMLNRLRLAKAPSSVFPFVMQVAAAVRNRGLPDAEGKSMLELLDAFLTRRALHRLEPTGLHAVFKSLWSDMATAGSLTRDGMLAQMLRHKTVQWPTDDEVTRSIKTVAYYGVSITPYVVRELDRALGGDPHATVAQIEHVLPQKPKKGEWAAFSKEETAALQDRLPNLLPLSKEMNPGLSNSEYAVKRPTYEKDSVFKSTREFAKTYSEWTPKTFAAREASLVSQILARWPDPRGSAPGGK